MIAPENRFPLFLIPLWRAITKNCGPFGRDHASQQTVTRDRIFLRCHHASLLIAALNPRLLWPANHNPFLFGPDGGGHVQN
ncbi:MAG: hypothetical protein WCF20_01715 [Methylovirgula sp.]